MSLQCPVTPLDRSIADHIGSIASPAIAMAINQEADVICKYKLPNSTQAVTRCYLTSAASCELIVPVITTELVEAFNETEEPINPVTGETE